MACTYCHCTALHRREATTASGACTGTGPQLTLMLLCHHAGPAGGSIREISRCTGADVKSWTSAKDCSGPGQIPRDTRVFVIEVRCHHGRRSRPSWFVMLRGLMRLSCAWSQSSHNIYMPPDVSIACRQGDREAVVAALDIIVAAVERYKNLCEGAYCGKNPATHVVSAAANQKQLNLPATAAFAGSINCLRGWLRRQDGGPHTACHGRRVHIPASSSNARAVCGGSQDAGRQTVSARMPLPDTCANGGGKLCARHGGEQAPCSRHIVPASTRQNNSCAAMADAPVLRCAGHISPAHRRTMLATRDTPMLWTLCVCRSKPHTRTTFSNLRFAVDEYEWAIVAKALLPAREQPTVPVDQQHQHGTAETTGGCVQDDKVTASPGVQTCVRPRLLLLPSCSRSA